jgi:hypothetical protein
VQKDTLTLYEATKTWPLVTTGSFTPLRYIFNTLTIGEGKIKCKMPDEFKSKWERKNKKKQTNSMINIKNKEHGRTNSKCISNRSKCQWRKPASQNMNILSLNK